MSVLIGCLSSCSYIKPQHNDGGALCRYGCLSSCSYIKPQQSRDDFAFCRVVYHLVPTSNHNSTRFVKNPSKLFIILFLHQTTTIDGVQTFSRKVVYHLVPTSNHNFHFLAPFCVLLFIILFLHQTTTMFLGEDWATSCLSSCSYIKPQQTITNAFVKVSCLSSCSYIKPQPTREVMHQLPGCLSSCSYIKPQRFYCCLL